MRTTVKGMTLRKLNPHGHTESIEQAMPADVWITKPIMYRTKNLKDDAADPPHNGPKYLERGMISAEDGEEKDM